METESESDYWARVASYRHGGRFDWPMFWLGTGIVLAPLEYIGLCWFWHSFVG
jgi:hypothetical protein